MTNKSHSPNLPTCVGLALLMTIGLAGCADNKRSDSGSGPIIITPPPPPPPPLIEDTFGARFGTIFRTNANTEPVDPIQSDINPPVTATIEPSKLRP